MLHSDPLQPRPTLVNPNHLASAVDQLGHHAASQAEVWHLLTQNFIVDLDAVAVLLPRSEPEPHWLPTRR
ncbi:hypothetical protein [Methylobacterium sp.]|jgi:hypothetical protein|uniref:hypothetical protein n=1 Tax=Methylobacterium sp. TaxID=409 RepID=UPI0025EAE8AC|nr:hypothetical protein [Methylobacterium sp.]MBY0260099.1 hypothetical protein [Methylobacterium sp.]